MSLALRILEITFPIFSLVAVGFIYGYRYQPDMKLPNKLNLDVFIPALLFSVLIEHSHDADLFSPFAFCIVVVILGSGLIGLIVARATFIQARTLCPTVMFGNAGNLGLPLMVLTFGDRALPIAVVMFVVCNFMHITLGNLILNQTSNIYKALLTPMIIAVFAAMLLNFMHVTVPDLILQPISMMGNICVPLMLFALGVRLVDTQLSEWRFGLIAAFLTPLSGIVWVLLLMPFVELNRLEQGVLFLFAALPPAVMNFMFAEMHDQEPGRVAAMVLFGNAMGLLTIPAALSFVLINYQ